ncbi:MAG: type II toxin-antitoxin system PrlF family antitoxin [Xenococcaceae cyanobacterium MO_167.B52]|nr:type II toxin-antitoxin system PrlF family antitoxin [Xenococcaceae cyanobacterium MO_167.B52]
MTSVDSPSQSTLTQRYQTTIPLEIRKALGLEAKDKIQYKVMGDGQVLMSKVETFEEDPAMASFLNFLDRDIQLHPENIQPITADIAEMYLSSVTNFDVDLDAALPNEE